MNKFPLLLICCICLSTIVLTGCGNQYELSGQIIGKWKMSTFDGREVSPDASITIEFREDESYTAVNEAGELEEVSEYDSSFFREKGTFEGFYKVDAPKGFDLREKYRATSFYSAVEVEGTTLSMQFSTDGEGDDKWVKSEFEKVN